MSGAIHPRAFMSSWRVREQVYLKECRHRFQTFLQIYRKAEFQFYSSLLTYTSSGFGGLEVACWPLVPKFKPCRSRRIFQGEKILRTPSFGWEVKPFVPCRRFTACKTSLNVTWKSGIFRQNSSPISLPSSSSFHY